MSDFAFELEKRLPTVPEYLRLREAVGWRVTPGEATRTAIRSSLFSVCATTGGEVIGLGRVVGDGGLYFYVQDLIVVPLHQKRGIGAAIMEQITRFLDETAGEGALIALLSAPGLERFYAHHGFSQRAEDIDGTFMIKRR